MLGEKINEFDNSDGTIESFNRIFPKTKLEGEGYVEILDIVDSKNICSSSVFVRNIDVNGKVIQHDFGSNNFFNNKDFSESDYYRFKYFAEDLCGNLMAVGYNAKELAKKMKCSENIVKNRLNTPIDENSITRHKFNVKRIEI